MNNAVSNPFVWIEIYVEDLKRAQTFYENVLQINMIPMQTPGDFGDLQMLSFPSSENGYGISGALCKTSHMKPGSNGTIVYFGCEDCANEISRVKQFGGEIIQEKESIGEHGFCAIGADSEGNTVGFHSMN